MNINFSVVTPTNLGEASRQTHPVTFEGFCEDYYHTVLGQPADTQKQDLVGVCPGVFSDGRRLNKNFEEATLLHADIDEGLTPELLDKLKGDLDGRGYSYLLTPSPSSSPEHLKYRLYLPLVEPVRDAAVYKAGYMETLTAHFPYITFDESCKDPARFMYVPNCSKLPEMLKCTSGGAVEFIEKRIATPTNVSERSRQILDAKDSKPLSPREVACRDWAIQTFNLVVGEHTPHSPFRLESDSGNYKVHIYGIYDFQDESVIRYDELYEAVVEDAKPVHPYFMDLWKSKDCPVLDERVLGPDPTDERSIPQFVEVPGRVGWYFTLTSNKPEKLQDGRRFTLDSQPRKLDVCLAAIKDRLLEPYFGLEFMGWTDEGNFKFYKDAKILARLSKVPEKTIKVIGAAVRGKYYCPETFEIHDANHGLRKVKPTFHQSVADFIDNLQIDTEWFNKYLYFSHDCEYKMPWLHMFGVAKSGKTFLAELIASIFTSDPLKNPISDSGFTTGWGDSPFMLMDEQIPVTRNAVKSPINQIKEIITSYKSTVNRKYEKEAMVQGYHRMLSTQNTPRPQLPLDKDSLTLGALVRRIMPIHFAKEQVEYLESVSSKVKSAWLYKGHFAEHVAWIRENKDYQPEDDMAISPLKNKWINDNTANIDQTTERFLEGVVEFCNSPADKLKPSGQEGCNDVVVFTGTDLTKYLEDNKATKERLCVGRVKDMLNAAKLPVTKDRNAKKGDKRVRGLVLQKADLDRVAAVLNGDDEEEV